MLAMIVVTILSTVFATAAGVIALRLVREERLRSAARVKALAADIYGLDREQPSPVRVSDLFVAVQSAKRPPVFTALAVGAVVVTLIATGVVLLSGGTRRSASSRPATEAARQAAVDPAPLELTALDHVEQGGRLVVRGTVRERAPFQAHGPIVAVVVALNGEGAVVGSGQAPVETGDTSAGGDVESTFSVAITGAGDIQRYRVSFRSDERTMTHVDKRGHLVTARLP